MKLLACTLLLFAAACTKTSAMIVTNNPLIAARPYDSFVPTHYDASKPTPLVVSLHGYGETAFVQDSYFGLSAFADGAGFLLAEPNGKRDAQNHPYWNATDACCDFGNSGVDDVAYLDAVIDDMEGHFNVDPKRVFLIGHSNGGFMSHRLACDSSPRIAAFVSLAGAQWKDASKCQPSSPVAVLQVHGDADTEVPYGGSTAIPSAKETVADWAKLDGCGATLDSTGTTLDLDFKLPGAETTVDRYACTSGAAELWTIHGGSHTPDFSLPDWPSRMWGFLMAHPKP